MKSSLLTRTAILAVLTLVSGLIRLPLGPIPLTFQTLAVFLTGLLLPPFPAALAMTLHLFLKLILEGAALIASPTFGFVLAFIPAAALLAFSSGNKPFFSFKKVLALFASLALIYFIGFLYAAFLFPQVSRPALGSSLLLFLPGDLFKGLLALVLAARFQALCSPQR